MSYGSILGKSAATWNKEQILSSTTAALFGLGVDAVPDDVFAFLGKYNQYWWRRRSIERVMDNGTPTTGTIALTKVYSSGSASNSYVQYSSEAEVVLENGVYKAQLKNPQDTVTLSTSNYSIINNLKGNYFYKTVNRVPDTTVVYYYPEDAGNVSLRSSYVDMPNAQIVSVNTVVGDWEYIKSSDRSAYPDSGEQDGYEYQYLGIPFDNAVNVPKIETGSYIGTGTYGSSNPNTLTFGFVPSLVIISYRYNASRVAGVFQGIFTPAIYTSTYSDMGYCYSFDSSNTNCFAKISGNTLYWYANTASLQLNTSGQTFSYTAIG